MVVLEEGICCNGGVGGGICCNGGVGGGDLL